MPHKYSQREWSTFDKRTKERIKSDGENVSREVDAEVSDKQKVRRYIETRRRWSSGGYP